MSDIPPMFPVPVTSQSELTAKYKRFGKVVVLKCELSGRGLEWLGYGATIGDALVDLCQNIRKYIDKYPA